MGNRYKEPNNTKVIQFSENNNLYSYSMLEYLPAGKFYDVRN